MAKEKFYDLHSTELYELNIRSSIIIIQSKSLFFLIRQTIAYFDYN